VREDKLYRQGTKLVMLCDGGETGTQGWVCVREGGLAYAVFTNAYTVVQLAHHPFEFLLQSQATDPLLGSGHGQSEDPSLEHLPHGGACAARLNWCNVGIVLLNSICRR
jgi:hypothetical protein